MKIKKWIVSINGERHTVLGDEDGHLELWVEHEDGTPVYALNRDLETPNGWLDSFTSERIEDNYRKKLTNED
jgi:hypothetical protein